MTATYIRLADVTEEEWIASGNFKIRLKGPTGELWSGFGMLWQTNPTTKGIQVFARYIAKSLDPGFPDIPMQFVLVEFPEGEWIGAESDGMAFDMDAIEAQRKQQEEDAATAEANAALTLPPGANRNARRTPGARPPR